MIFKLVSPERLLRVVILSGSMICNVSKINHVQPLRPYYIFPRVLTSNRLLQHCLCRYHVRNSYSAWVNYSGQPTLIISQISCLWMISLYRVRCHRNLRNAGKHVAPCFYVFCVAGWIPQRSTTRLVRFLIAHSSSRWYWEHHRNSNSFHGKTNVNAYRYAEHIRM